jgi:hypothetical protein
MRTVHGTVVRVRTHFPPRGRTHPPTHTHTGASANKHAPLRLSVGLCQGLLQHGVPLRQRLPLPLHALRRTVQGGKAQRPVGPMHAPHPNMLWDRRSRQAHLPAMGPPEHTHPRALACSCERRKAASLSCLSSRSCSTALSDCALATSLACGGEKVGEPIINH